MKPHLLKISLKLYVSACLFLMTQLVMNMLYANGVISLTPKSLSLSDPDLKKMEVMGVNAQKPDSESYVSYQSSSGFYPYNQFTISFDKKGYFDLNVSTSETDGRGMILGSDSPLPYQYESTDSGQKYRLCIKLEEKLDCFTSSEKP